jgi:hypothetical protein
LRYWMEKGGWQDCEIFLFTIVGGMRRAISMDTARRMIPSIKENDIEDIAIHCIYIKMSEQSIPSDPINHAVRLLGLWYPSLRPASPFLLNSGYDMRDGRMNKVFFPAACASRLMPVSIILPTFPPGRCVWFVLGGSVREKLLS